MTLPFKYFMYTVLDWDCIAKFCNLKHHSGLVNKVVMIGRLGL
jgi:hypothetical protein